MNNFCLKTFNLRTYGINKRKRKMKKKKNKRLKIIFLTRFDWLPPFLSWERRFRQFPSHL